MKWNVNKKDVGKFMDRQGFYIVLFACVVVIGLTAAWASSGKDSGVAEATEPPEILLAETLPEPTLQPAQQAMAGEPAIIAGEAVKTVTQTAQPVAASAETEAEEEETETGGSAYTFIAPSEGAYGMLFSDDTLVFSRTLGQWTTHKGVDIAAIEGTEVKASLGGVVAEVGYSKLMGNTVVIEHNGGLKTVYSSLKSTMLPKAGDKISQGDVIGIVGNTAFSEIEEGSHLHFEVWVNGEAVDPLTWLPAQAQE